MSVRPWCDLAVLGVGWVDDEDVAVGYEELRLHRVCKGRGSAGSRAVEAAFPARDNADVAACANCGTELPVEARFCPSCAAPVERAPEPAEERKVATVLFADLVGST